MTNTDLLRFGESLRAWMNVWLDEGSRSAAETRVHADFDQRALALFALQFEQVPPYRRLCEARGVSPAALARWEDIPAVPTAAFKDFDFSSLAVAERAAVFHSSGTTGQRPSRQFHDALSLSWYGASLLSGFRRHVLGGSPGATEKESSGGQSKLKFIVLTPEPAEAPRSSLAHMFGAVTRTYGAADSVFSGRHSAEGRWRIDVPATRRALESAVAEGRPVCLLTTAFLLVQLLDELAAARASYALPAGSRALETGGYKGQSRVIARPDLHRLTTHQLGIPASHIVREYGMCELSSQAYDLVIGQGRSDAQEDSQRVSRMFRFPPWARAQVVSPESGRPVGEGETGLLRIFDLANVRSVLAVQTEDLAVRLGPAFDLVGRLPSAQARGCSLLAA